MMLGDGPTGSGPLAVEIEDLSKRYGNTVALDHVSLQVAEGEIFGILGPNGAGKTTAVECLVGLRTPDSGRLRVFGLDPHRDRSELHAQVGVQLQQSAFPDRLKVSEIEEMYRSFYHNPVEQDLIEGLGLGDKRHSYYQALSGGQRQRLSVALALIGRPRLAVLDEMTTGLDPQARHDVWELIRGVRARGTTLVLVTHFMEEAERLCDRVALLDSGRVVAVDSPDGLAGQGAGSRHLRFTPSGAFDDALLTALPDVEKVEHEGPHVIVTGRGDLLNDVVLTLAGVNVRALDLSFGSSTLEDAFLRLTGHHLDEAGKETRP